MAIWMGTRYRKRYCNGYMNVTWALNWGGSRSTKPCDFLCAVAAGDEGCLLCAGVAVWIVSRSIGFPLVFCSAGI